MKKFEDLIGFLGSCGSRSTGQYYEAPQFIRNGKKTRVRSHVRVDVENKVLVLKTSHFMQHTRRDFPPKRVK